MDWTLRLAYAYPGAATWASKIGPYGGPYHGLPWKAPLGLVIERSNPEWEGDRVSLFISWEDATGISIHYSQYEILNFHNDWNYVVKSDTLVEGSGELPPPPPPPGEGFALTVSAAPPEGGVVDVVPQESVYEPGTSVVLRAISSEGYEFISWSGDASGTTPETSIVMDSDKYVIANFVETIKLNVPIVGPILQWLQALIADLKKWILAQLTWVIDHIKAVLEASFSILLSPLITAVTWIKEKVLEVWDWVKEIYGWVKDLAKNIATTVSTAVTGAIGAVGTWIDSAVFSIRNFITTKMNEISAWLTNLYTSVTGWFSAQITQLSDFITGIPAAITDWIEAKLEPIFGWVPVEGTTIWDRIKAFFKGMWMVLVPWGPLVGGMPHIPLYIKDEKGELIPAHYDLEQQKLVPGEDPNTFSIKAFVKEHIADPILDAIKNVWNWLWTKITDTWGAITDGIKRFFTETLPGWFEALWDKIKAGATWVKDKVSEVIDGFLDDILALVGIHSPIMPEGGLGTFKGVIKIGLALAGGLGLMTVAGNLVHPLHSLGLEHISAMVYDMTNYKLLIGAGMGVIAAASIRTPMTQYMNKVLRPNIPSERDAAEMYDRELIPYSLYSQYLSLRGYPDMWHKPMAALTETPLRYFGLAAVARSGYFDPKFFDADLIRGGYAPETRKILLDMFAKTSSETVRGMMSGTAIKRFKEGFTTESQFAAEMTLLGYSTDQLPTFLAAAKLDYAYDYLTDLVTAFRDAVRKGNISLDEYRSTLLGLGIVPERVEGYILKERARLKPQEPLKPISPMKPTYETDAGKIKVDTLRRQRRKEIITTDQEIAALLSLGIDTVYAQAIADNDAIRLTKTGE